MVILRQKYIKKRVFFLNACFLRCRLRIWNPFLGVGIGNPIFFRFFPYFFRKWQWGTRGESGVLGGGTSLILIKQIVKKNQFILRECVEETYRKKEEMVAIAIDFKKAYDSIKRETMVQILKELRIDSKIIDFIVRIYREDSTKIQLEKNKEIEIEVTSGIRQGCTASTVLFKLITYKIIEEMRKTEGIQILGQKLHVSSMQMMD